MIFESGSTPEEWVRAVTRMIVRIVLVAAIIVGAVYVLGRLKVVVISLFVAATLAYIMRPMAGWLIRQLWFVRFHEFLAGWFAGAGRLLRALKGRPLTPPGGRQRLSQHGLRIIATIYVLILLFIGGWYAIKFTINPFVHEVRNVTENWALYRAQFEQYGKDARKWYEDRVPPEWRRRIEETLTQSQEGGDLQKRVAEWVGEGAKRLGEIAHYVVEIVLLPVLAFYFALDSKKLKHEFVGALPARYRREVLRTIREFNLIMYSFVVGQAILCAIAGVVVGVGLLGLGVKYPLTLGLLAGFTRAIPIIGPILGGIPIVLLVLLTKGVSVALAVLAFFTFLHFAESKFIMPYLIGERMNLHPVVIIVVLLIGAEFGGLLGMFFAAPVASLIRVVVRRYVLRTHRRRSPTALQLTDSTHVPEVVD